MKSSHYTIYWLTDQILWNYKCSSLFMAETVVNVSKISLVVMSIPCSLVVLQANARFTTCGAYSWHGNN